MELGNTNNSSSSYHNMTNVEIFTFASLISGNPNNNIMLSMYFSKIL